MFVCPYVTLTTLARIKRRQLHAFSTCMYVLNECMPNACMLDRLYTQLSYQMGNFGNLVVIEQMFLFLLAVMLLECVLGESFRPGFNGGHRLPQPGFNGGHRIPKPGFNGGHRIPKPGFNGGHRLPQPGFNGGHLEGFKGSIETGPLKFKVSVKGKPGK
jgi:hypothetical protein